MQKLLLALGGATALLLHGSFPLVVLHTFRGDAPGDRLGAAVAGVGDLDGDGWPDLLVGVPHADPAGPSSGLAIAYSGRDGTELHRIAGDDPSDRFGTAVAGTGDVDGDGRDDFVVGAPLGTPSAGSASVFSGRTGAVLWTWTGDAPGDRFGQSVAGAGDADGDGCPDVAVGAPFSDQGGTNAGRVRVFSGRTGGVLHTFDGAAWDQLGAAVAGVGDVDGDGRDDLLVGAPLADGTAFNSGSAFVFSGADASQLRAIHGAAAGDRLGSVVAAAGDVDGDGTPDLVVGIPAADANGFDSGAVEVRSGANGGVLLAVAGESQGEFFQEGAGVGDVDGDGRPDLLVGSASGPSAAPGAGRLRLISGRTARVIADFEGRSPDDWLGARVSRAGDVDRDGWPDLLAGAPGHDDDPTKAGYAVVLSTRQLARHADARPPLAGPPWKP